jgi:hypothetical protein
MPSPEWVKETSINNVQEFFTSPGQCVSSASKPLPTWRNKANNGGPLNGNGTVKGKGNNVNLPQKESNSGNSSGDDSLDRHDHAPRVVAVAMKTNKTEVPHQLRTAVHGKGQNGPPYWTVKNSDTNVIQPETSFKPVCLEQILNDGSSRKEQDFVEKLPVISGSNCLTHAGERKQVEKPLSIVSAISGSVNGSINNLSTIIAVNSDGSQEEIHADANTELSIDKPTAEKEPLSSTVIVVNCANSHKDISLNSHLLPSKMKDFNDKSLVRREIKQNQPAAGVKVTVNISTELERCNDIPPPIPPLPVALRRKFFNKEGIIINAKEPRLKVEPVLPSVNGKAPLPLNRLCLHPKIKLKCLQSSPPTFSSHKPSRIPKLCPTPTGLRSVDCLVSLYEDGIAAEQRRKEIQKEGERKKKISRSLKQGWEELFKKYEALEKECDSMGSVTRRSECNYANLLSMKKGSVENMFTLNHNNSFKTVKDSNHEVFKRIEVGRLKSAPCSLLHLKDAAENDSEKGSQSVVCRTNSEVNLCSKAVKERECPKFISCKEKTWYRTSSKSEKEINNNQVVLGQSVCEGDSAQCLGTGAVLRLGNVETGGIGVVRANTGRQVSSCRYRTELEV